MTLLREGYCVTISRKSEGYQNRGSWRHSQAKSSGENPRATGGLHIWHQSLSVEAIRTHAKDTSVTAVKFTVGRVKTTQ